MADWQDWRYKCEKCGHTQTKSLKEVDWDAHPFNESAADMNRSIEANMKCPECGSNGPFDKQGRAFGRE